MCPVKIQCQKCGSYYLGRLTKLEEDDTPTCECGNGIPLNEAQRAEANRAFEEDVQEFNEAISPKR